MIPVNIKGVAYDASGNPIILLTDQEDKKVLPIWVGALEAYAIAVALEKITMSRPLTHDLLKNICTNLGANITQIVITDLLENTFYAEIHICISDKEMVIDSRPSDAIALALRTSAPVFLVQKLSEHMLQIKDLVEEEIEDELQQITNTFLKDNKKVIH
ncbi:MAG: bifunctional nuclease family protein [Eubacteriales bacterium]